MQRLKPVFAVAANAIPLAVIVLLAFNYLAQSFTYKDDFETERSQLATWLLVFLVPLAVNVSLYFISRAQLKKLSVPNIAFAKRAHLTVAAFILAALLTIVVPWLATLALSPVPVVGTSFWGVLSVGAALNALASAGSVYLFTPLAR